MRLILNQVFDYTSTCASIPVDQLDYGGTSRPSYRGEAPSPLLVGANARKDWIRWKEDWTDYATVQDLASKSDAIQTSLFRISVGADGKKLLRNQPVPEDDEVTR